MKYLNFTAKHIRYFFTLIGLISLSILASAATTYEAEPNETIFTATTVTLGDHFIGASSGYYDVDYFKIYIPSAGIYTLRHDPLLPNVDRFSSVTATIYDANSNTLGTLYFAVDTSASRSFRASSAGYLFIKVTSASEREDFQLILTNASPNTANTYEAEPNETTATSTTVNLGDHFIGASSGYYDEDYFKISIPSAGLYTLRHDPLLPNVDRFSSVTATIYNANSSTLGTLNFTVDSSASRSFQASSAGFLLIKVTSASERNDYRLVLVPQFPWISVTPISLSFAEQGIATTSTSQSITVTNTGGATLNFSSLASYGDFGGTHSCTSSLAIGANCSINVNFSPTDLGTRNGSVVITSNAANSPFAISMTGNGVESPTALLSPMTLTFDEQNTGTTSYAQYVTLSNTGGAALIISSIEPTISVFGATHNCGSTVVAGGSCSIGVTFTPTAVGTRLGGVRVTSNAPGSPHLVTVSGPGVVAKAPVCSLSASPATINRGGSSTMTASCSPSANTFTWTGGGCAGTTGPNCSDRPTTITTYRVTGTNAYGSSSSTAVVTVKPFDMSAILMLLLED
jgi:hypothetical protein